MEVEALDNERCACETIALGPRSIRDQSAL